MSVLRPMLVDSHAHIFLKNHQMQANRRYTPNYDASLADYMTVLEMRGCTHGVLVQPSFLGINNSYLLKSLQLYPDRLRGVVTVEPGTPRNILESFKAKGVVGARLNLINTPSPDFSTPVWRTHLENIAALGWQLEVQAEAARLAEVIKVCRQAGITLVIDHFGRPDPVLGIEDSGFRALLESGQSETVFVKLSAPYRLAPGERGYDLAGAAVPLLIKAFGAQRLVWGSDWPQTEFENASPPLDSLASLEQWVPDADERRAILSTTPAGLFRFAAKESCSLEGLP